MPQIVRFVLGCVGLSQRPSLSQRVWNVLGSGSLSSAVVAALWSVFDELVQQATLDVEAVSSARRLYSELTGTVEPSHELFVPRSDAFVEWFLLEHRDVFGQTPVQRRLSTMAPDDKTRPHLLALRASYRSLFQLRGLKPKQIVLDDLIGGGRFLVEDNRFFLEITSDDLFEARLIPIPGFCPALCLGRALQFHPKEAAHAVLTLVQEDLARGKTRTDLLARLARLRVRASAYRHMFAARVYSQTAG
jgi:hypothetical protein